MKALYDKSDRDYYILFEEGEISKILAGAKLICLLYMRSSGQARFIEYMRPNFEIHILETNLDLFTRQKSLFENKSYTFSYSDVLLEYPLQGTIRLFLSKEWIEIGLNEELLNRCGMNEQRYCTSGSKVHFYSKDSKHMMTSQQNMIFESEEIAWTKEYGNS
ncbi:MAG: hypothetical protein WC011_00155 [Candidatus Paceibacterota bacterium]